jgi:hypothetical protein
MSWRWSMLRPESHVIESFQKFSAALWTLQIDDGDWLSRSIGRKS